mmetsp:Transcript_41613/g.97774  ORF Transcript_41613/g.97774 Transcript_41613/m.97774 type:complete len:208 (-) Transcript_41613:1874-2497(-)
MPERASSESKWMASSPLWPPFLVRFFTRTSTVAPSASASSSSSRSTSRLLSPLTRSKGVWRAAPWALATSFSASRTLSFFAAISLAVVICVAPSSGSSARAWPMSRSPAISMACTGAARFSRRSRLLAALRDRPTVWAACSCVRPNSSVSRFRPWASSSGLRSSRWMFSISAIAAADSSGTSLTSTGTSRRPASLAARNRRSPAMIS